MTITAKDIAEKLNVSPSAVSLAINGKPGVSEETRERILTEAARTGYSVHRRDTPVSTKNIRYVIFQGSGSSIEENSFSSEVLQGIEAKAREYGYNMLVSYFYADGDWAEQTLSICREVSGLIILVNGMEPENMKRARALLLRQKMPKILVNSTATFLSNIDCVSMDNLQGAELAVRYLLDMGHPDVGYLRAKTRTDQVEERQSGVVYARRAFGCSKCSSMQCIDVGTTPEQAFQDLCKWLDHGGQPLSALFADNDVIAAASIRALKSRGYRVPEDVSVVGFGNRPFCTMMEPALTSVRVMKEQMGAVAMELLHRRVCEKGCESAEKQISFCRTIISANLVRRDSVARYQGQSFPEQRGREKICAVSR